MAFYGMNGMGGINATNYTGGAKKGYELTLDVRLLVKTTGGDVITEFTKAESITVDPDGLEIAQDGLRGSLITAMAAVDNIGG